MSGTPHESKRFQQRFLLGTVAAVSVLFLWMIRDFLVAVLLAAIFTGMAQPVYTWLVQKTGGREGLSAATVVALLLLVVVGPLTTFLGLVVAQAVELSGTIGPWVQQQLAEAGGLGPWLESNPILDRFPWLESVLPDRQELVKRAGQAASSIVSVVAAGLTTVTRNTVSFLLNVFILLYAMFFFLLRGREVLDRILFYAPLASSEEQAVVDRFVSVTRATLRGSLVIGILQGGMAGIAMWLAGIQGALLWSTVMAVLSVIPGVGVAVVWVPAAVWLFVTGEVLTGVLFCAWCGGVVGTIDNVMRPRLVGADAEMSDLMILLGTLGGISLFGAVGFLIGPIVAAVFVTVWELYGRAFHDVLPPLDPRPHDDASPAETEPGEPQSDVTR